MIETDGALDTDPDPETPFKTRPSETVSATAGRELLIGRNDPARDIHPEIALHDPGASRRHAKIVAAADGTLLLHDLSPTNGTKLNGADVPGGSRHPLAEGDQILIGRWTRLVVRRRS